MYKFDNPHEWLGHHIESLASKGELRFFIAALASMMDGDAIQELFQYEMAADGYFEDDDVICPYAGTTDCLDPEERCSHRVAHVRTAACTPALGCPACGEVEE